MPTFPERMTATRVPRTALLRGDSSTLAHRAGDGDPLVGAESLATSAATSEKRMQSV